MAGDSLLESPHTNEPPRYIRRPVPKPGRFAQAIQANNTVVSVLIVGIHVPDLKSQVFFIALVQTKGVNPRVAHS